MPHESGGSGRYAPAGAGGREHVQAPASLNFSDIEAGGFTLLGLAGIMDPPREEAIAAVADATPPASA
jgi:magnesium-transporting ATPase (P-type)